MPPVVRPNNSKCGIHVILHALSERGANFFGIEPQPSPRVEFKFESLADGLERGEYCRGILHAYGLKRRSGGQTQAGRWLQPILQKACAPVQAEFAAGNEIFLTKSTDGFGQTRQIGPVGYG